MNALKFTKGIVDPGTVLKGKNTMMDVDGVATGPTSTTGWYAPPAPHNGYTIGIMTKGGPLFWCPANDSEVILFCNTTAYPSPSPTLTTIDEALIFLQDSRFMVTYNNTTLRSTTSLSGFPAKLPMEGLSCYLDAQIEQSSGTTNRWFDISGNGLEFQSYGTALSLANLGGYQGFEFNGSGYFQCNDKYGSVNMGGDCTLIMWLWAEGISERDTVFEKAGTGSGTGGGTSYQQEIAVTWETSNGFSYYSRKTPNYDSAGGDTCTLGAWNMISIKMSTGLTTAARTGFRSKNGGNYAASYNSRSNVAIVPSAQIRVGTGYAGPVEGGNGVGAILTYNRMLSDAEISQVYQSTKGKFGL
tara:strand:+ start:60 stop:1130 length:1071 start_codon:yes stop_codon:yes gene_type:complete